MDERWRPKLRIVDGDGELAGELCPHCHETEMALRSERAKVTTLRGRLARQEAAEAQDEEIIEVLAFWRDWLAPRAGISEGSANWTMVAKRLQDIDKVTGERRFNVKQLKAAVVGVSYDPYCMAKGETYRRHPGVAFNDPDRVGRFIERARTFWRQTGEDPLGIMEDLGGPALSWLAERCSCEHTWLEHLRGGEAAQGGAQRCSHQDCGCTMFDFFHAKVERFLREQDV